MSDNNSVNSDGSESESREDKAALLGMQKFMEAQFSKLSSQIDSQKIEFYNKLEDIEKRINKKDKKLQAKLKSQRAELSILRNDMTGINFRQTQLTDQLSTIQNSMESQKSELSILRNDMTGINSRQTQLTGQLSTIQNSMESQRAELSILRNDMDENISLFTLQSATNKNNQQKIKYREHMHFGNKDIAFAQSSTYDREH